MLFLSESVTNLLPFMLSVTCLQDISHLLLKHITGYLSSSKYFTPLDGASRQKTFLSSAARYDYHQSDYGTGTRRELKYCQHPGINTSVVAVK